MYQQRAIYIHYLLKNYICRPFSAKENSQLDNHHYYLSTIYRQIMNYCMIMHAQKAKGGKTYHFLLVLVVGEFLQRMSMPPAHLEHIVVSK